MSQKVGNHNNKVYRLVLTGGPCGGKTTGQARLCTFFENLGWKVYRVPETATMLMGGGVKWSEFSDEEAYRFQEMLLQTMMQVEQVYFTLAAGCRRDCLIICDRGTMDASAYLKPDQWERMKKSNNWNNVELRDNRYNQVIHMVSAANGAEPFYATAEHATRYENIEHARQLDGFAAQAWVGHPYFDVIDNSTGFEAKVMRMIASVCNRLGIDAGDRLQTGSKKRKFLIRQLPEGVDLKTTSINGEGLVDESGVPLSMVYPQFQDFIVIHDYLVTPNSKMQARIRRRGQSVRWDNNKGRWDVETDNRLQISQVVFYDDEDEDDDDESKAKKENEEKMFICGTDQDFSHWTYTHTIRRPEIKQESPELKMQISSREYKLLLAQRDDQHHTIYKKRRSFLWNNQYFQMDIYQQPCHPRCDGLILLETYTTLKGDDLKLPDFLDVAKEVTHDSNYSMFNLSRKVDDPQAKNVQSYTHGVINGDIHTINGTNATDVDAHTNSRNGEVTEGVKALVIEGDEDCSSKKTAASVM